jgi:hypothetical protein
MYLRKTIPKGKLGSYAYRRICATPHFLSLLPAYALFCSLAALLDNSLKPAILSFRIHWFILGTKFWCFCLVV